MRRLFSNFARFNDYIVDFMKKISQVLWVLAALMVLTINTMAQTAIVPTFHDCSYEDGSIVMKISDNGLWGVAQPAYDDAKASGQARLVDIKNNSYVIIQTSEDVLANGACTINDVSNDGNIVVGGYTGLPAYWNATTKKWKYLPLPEGAGTAVLTAVTPDGKYAIGNAYFDENEYWIEGAMWDLTTNSIKELPNRPRLDMTHEDQHQQRFDDISADGRYVLISMSVSYIMPAGICSYVYDTQTNNSTFVGFTPNDTKAWTPMHEGLYFIQNPKISSNGKWVTGTAYMVKENGGGVPDEYDAAFRMNMETGIFELFDEEEGHGYGGFGIDNSGNVYAATPATATPIREWSVRHGNYWYPFSQIMKQNYGIDFYQKTGYDNTGSPVSVSGDGLFINSMVDPQSQSYVVELGKNISEECASINLLGNYSITPANGCTFSSLLNVTVAFDRFVDVKGTKADVELRDETGNVVRTASGLAVTTSDAKAVIATFRPTILETGKNYTVVFKAGCICLKGDTERTNNEISVTYTGRDNKPMTITSIYPEENCEFATYSSSVPVVFTFDADVALTDTASAYLVRDEDGKKICDLNMLTADKRVKIFPATQQFMYLGQTYTVVLEAGAVTDLTGNNPNEKKTVKYIGTYERELSTDNETLFKDDFNNQMTSLSTYLRYEGDHLTPNASMEALGFDKDNQPWNFSVAESETSADYCAASHSMYQPSGKSDDWMIIPQLFIPDSYCEMNFKAQSYLNSKTDSLKVIILPCETAYSYASDELMALMKSQGKVIFKEKLTPGASEEGLADDWQSYNINLSEYAYKNVYIAFLNDNDDQSMVFVDDVEIKRNLKYLLSLANEGTVVNKSEIAIKGKVTNNSDSDTFSTITLILKDANGNKVDEISESGMSFKKNDSYSFAFSKPLPLLASQANTFTIAIALDNYKDEVKSNVNNLQFEPVKRLVVEENTGVTCPNCPLGIVAFENLENIYKDLVIPVSIHGYNNDPMGAGVVGYAEALGVYVAAPSAQINRNGIVCQPMWQSPYTFEYELSNGYNLWEDIAAQEMQTPAEAEISASVNYHEANGTFDIPVSVRYAMNAKNLNLNLFFVMLEDNIKATQANGLASVNSPALGDWGKGGRYGTATVYNYYHKDVARYCWGDSWNGSVGLLPQTMEAGKEYTVDITGLTLPQNLDDVTKAKMVVMLINANTGKVINAALAKFPGYTNGINSVDNDINHANISLAEGMITVGTNGMTKVMVYSATGALITSAAGNGAVCIPADAMHGTIIVKATCNGSTTVKKLNVR